MAVGGRVSPALQADHPHTASTRSPAQCGTMHDVPDPQFLGNASIGGWATEVNHEIDIEVRARAAALTLHPQSALRLPPVPPSAAGHRLLPLRIRSRATTTPCAPADPCELRQYGQRVRLADPRRRRALLPRRLQVHVAARCNRAPPLTPPHPCPHPPHLVRPRWLVPTMPPLPCPHQHRQPEHVPVDPELGHRSGVPTDVCQAARG